MATFRALLPRALGAAALGSAASILAVTLGMQLVSIMKAPSVAAARERFDSTRDALVLVSWFAAFLGMIPAMLVCAPILAYAAARGRASLPLALAIGAAPGLMLLGAGDELSGAFLLYGLPAALFTWALFHRRSLWAADDGAP